MFELPSHHVPRRRVLDGLERFPVVLLEAPSGFGKSTLAAELRRSGAPARVAQVTIHEEGGGDRQVLHPLRRALVRLGEDAAAAALAEPGDGVADALQAALEVLDAAPPLLLLIDDAHLLTDAGALLLQLVEHRPGPVRLVIGARQLPPGAARIRTRVDVRVLGPQELRFDVEDVRRLIEDGVGLDPATVDAHRLLATTEGWPAAVAFAVTQLARAEPGAEVADPAMRFSDQVAAALPATLRALAAALAHLPWMDDELAASVQDVLAPSPDAGVRESVLGRLLQAGLPLTTDAEGRTRFPGAIAEVLRGDTPLPIEVARAVCGAHLRHQRPEEAIAVLRSAGAVDDLGRLLGALPTGARAHLTADEIVAAIDALPRRVVDRYPTVLLELARAFARAGEPDDHAAVLRRLRTLLASSSDPQVGDDPSGAGVEELRRAVEAEQLALDVYTRPREEVAARVDEVLAAAGDDELATVARALVVRGMIHAWSGERGSARRALRRASQLFAASGEPHEASRALVQLGFNVDLHGDLARAEETFADAVRLAGQDGRARATALTYLGEVKVWLGRSREGGADLEQALRLAQAVRDARARAYAAWGLALQASLERDPIRTVAWAREAGEQLAAWQDTGVFATYLATMVDLVDRAGAHDEADALLARARARRDEQPELVALAEFVVAARRGDPAEAARLWQAVEADDGIERFERVRCRLLRAYAALRGGDPSVGALFTEATADAAAYGHPDLARWLEPEAAEALDRWQAVAQAGCTLELLGPMQLRRGDEHLRLPAGLPRAVVGLLAVADGPERIDTLVETLWPGVDTTDARGRLRQILYRLRSVAAELVERVGDDQLALGSEVGTDLARFERLAATAARDGNLDAARAALALVRGEVMADVALAATTLPLDAVRARVAVRRLGLLDQLVADADERGDDEQAVAWLLDAHRIDVHDERRAVRAARRLVDVGRVTDANAVLAATATALDHLGVRPHPRFEQARRALGAAAS